MPRPIIQASLDCSVSNPDRCIAYAGAVCYPLVQQSLQHEWGRVLDKYELPAFHMTDAMAFRGDFAEFRRKHGDSAPARRDDLINELIDLILKNDVRLIGFAENLLQFPTEKLRRARKQELFVRVISWLIDADIEEPKPRIAIQCDRENDLNEFFLKWLNKIQLHEPFKSRIAGLCLFNSEHVMTIQIADIAAYLLREDTERLLDGSRPQRTQFDRLLRRLKVLGKPENPQITRRDPPPGNTSGSSL